MNELRTIWKGSFSRDSIPEWTCPVCYKGTLIGSKKNFKVFESTESIAEHSLDEWEPEWMRGHFSGILTCNYSTCSEKIVVVGEMKYNETYNYEDDYDGSGFGLVVAEFLQPTYFIPSLKIFQVQKDVPKIIKEAIEESFKLYWLDTASCANKIRIVVERIMDDQNIIKTYLERGKRKRYSLHKRIELFRSTRPEEAESFMAIKWIGNFGSHTSDQLTNDDLLDAYDILDNATTKLYEKKSKMVRKLAKNINKRKKPVGTKRSK